MVSSCNNITWNPSVWAICPLIPIKLIAEKGNICEHFRAMYYFFMILEATKNVYILEEKNALILQNDKSYSSEIITGSWWWLTIIVCLKDFSFLPGNKWSMIKVRKCPPCFIQPVFKIIQCCVGIDECIWPTIFILFDVLCPRWISRWLKQYRKLLNSGKVINIQK